MRRFTADYVYPISSKPLSKGVVIVREDGTIEEVLAADEHAAREFPADWELQKYNGILCPGFINAHTHLELSHLKGKISEGNSLSSFITELLQNREAGEEAIMEAIMSAEQTMISHGIAGAGDICNTPFTIGAKKKARIKYHSFIELFDIHPSKTEKVFHQGLELYERFRNAGLKASLTPHAPYTVTPQLLKLIHDHAYTTDGLLSLHNQETESENAMFKKGSGPLFETLSSMGELYKGWKPTGFSSLSSTLVHLPKCNRTLLVHNTWSTIEDINWAQLYSPAVYWCFCPNANLYIEKKLPDLKLFSESSCKIVIGTDSYASNHSLSVLEELKTIQLHTPFKLQDLLTWATLNGAEFFGWQKELGSLEKGKKPGLNLITYTDLIRGSLLQESQVKPLVEFRG